STLRRALRPEFFDCGLAARLLVAQPSAQPKRWTEAEIQDGIVCAVDDLFARLYDLLPAPGPDGDAPVMVDLLDDARGDFAHFVNTWNEQLQALDGPAR